MVSLVNVDGTSRRHLLSNWLQRPHVTQWWGEAKARLEQFDETPDHEHAFIARSNTLIGYVRWQVVDRSDLDAVGITGIPDGSIDIDILIAEPDQTNRGVGPIALDILADQLAETTEAPLIGLCTSKRNHRAVRAFHKADFINHSDYLDPTFGPCWVMVRWFNREV